MVSKGLVSRKEQVRKMSGGLGEVFPGMPFQCENVTTGKGNNVTRNFEIGFQMKVFLLWSLEQCIFTTGTIEVFLNHFFNSMESVSFVLAPRIYHQVVHFHFF